MCGICGYLQLDLQTPADAHVVSRMNDRLAHCLLWQLLMFELWSREHLQAPVAAVC